MARALEPTGGAELAYDNRGPRFARLEVKTEGATGRKRDDGENGERVERQDNGDCEQDAP